MTTFFSMRPTSLANPGSAFDGDAARAQLLQHDGFELLQLAERGLDVGALALELGDAGAALFERDRELAHMARIGVVEVQHLADLGEAEAEPPPAQDKAEPRPVTRRIDARLPLAPGLQQPLILVEADGPVRAAELLRQVADGEAALIRQKLRPVGTLIT